MKGDVRRVDANSELENPVSHHDHFVLRIC